MKTYYKSMSSKFLKLYLFSLVFKLFLLINDPNLLIYIILLCRVEPSQFFPFTQRIKDELILETLQINKGRIMLASLRVMSGRWVDDV